MFVLQDLKNMDIVVKLILLYHITVFHAAEIKVFWLIVLKNILRGFLRWTVGQQSEARACKEEKHTHTDKKYKQTKLR